MVIESKRSVGSALRGGDITGLALKLLRKSTLRHQYHTGRARLGHENKRLRWVVPFGAVASVSDLARQSSDQKGETWRRKPFV